jgi:hypothetical protein
MRFDTSGTPDMSFGVAGRLTARPDTGGSRMQSIALQTNGKFITGGSQKPLNSSEFSLMRYKYVPDVTQGVAGSASAKSDLVIYPNPATNELNVELNGLADAEAIVTDMSGRMVSRQKLSRGRAFDIKGLTKGHYILSIENNGVKRSGTFEKR